MYDSLLFNQNDKFKQYTDSSLIISIEREFQEITKTIEGTRKIVETTLRKNDKILNTLHNSIQQNLKVSSEIEQFNILTMVFNSYCSELNQSNIQSYESLMQYSQESIAIVDELQQFMNDYIINSIKSYKSDEAQLKQSQNRYALTLEEYQNSIKTYQQNLNSPALRYNFNERSILYKQIGRVVKRAKEIESHIMIHIQLLNSRKKALSVDFLELRQITENSIIDLEQKTFKIIEIILGFQGQSRSMVYQNMQKLNLTHHKNKNISILPDPIDFQFTSGEGLRMVFRSPTEISSARRQYAMTSESFYSVNEDFQDNLSRASNKIDQFPQFIENSHRIKPQEMVHFPDFLTAYCRKFKENCYNRLNSIKVVLQFLEDINRIGNRQVISNQFNTPIPFLSSLNSFELVIQDQNEIINLFTQLSQCLNTKIQQISRLGSDLQEKQAYLFLGLNKIIQEIQKSKIDFLRNEGLIQNNDRMPLIPQNYNIENSKYFQTYRNLVQESCASVMSLMGDFTKDDKRIKKSLTDFLKSIWTDLGQQLKDSIEFNLNLLKVLYKSQDNSTVGLLRKNNTFKLLYKKSPTSNYKYYLDYIIKDNETDYQFISRLDTSVLLQLTLPREGFELDEKQPHSETEQSQGMLSDDVHIDYFIITKLKKDFEKQLAFISTKIQLEQNETLLNSFACALSEKMQLQGRLYLTNNRLFFHSNFNSSNLFFKETMLNIPRQDIIQIEKRMNAYIFDNSLAITTPKGQLFFASFFYRDKAYEQIIKIFNLNQKQETDDPNPLAPSDLAVINFTEEQIQMVEKRALRVEASIGPELRELVAIEKFNYPWLNVRRFFKLFLEDQAVTGGGQTFINRWTKLKWEALGLTNIVCTNWNLDPPVEFSDAGFESIVQCEQNCISRVVTYTSPMPPTSVPFMPKQCDCKEEQNIYFVSLDKIVSKVDVYTYKVPSCESFFCRVHYVYENQQDGGIKMTTKVEVLFLKSTILRKAIESTTYSEVNKSHNNKLIPLIKRELDSINASMLSEGKIKQQDQLFKLDSTPTNENLGQKQGSSYYNRTIKLITIAISILGITLGLYFLYSNILKNMRLQINFKEDM